MMVIRREIIYIKAVITKFVHQCHVHQTEREEEVTENTQIQKWTTIDKPQSSVCPPVISLLLLLLILMSQFHFILPNSVTLF